MAVTTTNVVNRNYTPDDLEDDILAILKEGREEGTPWGRATPKYLTERLGVRRQYIGRALDSLSSAGWVQQKTRGFYELVEDPREADQ